MRVWVFIYLIAGELFAVCTLHSRHVEWMVADVKRKKYPFLAVYLATMIVASTWPVWIVKGWMRAVR